VQRVVQSISPAAIHRRLRSLGRPADAAVLQRFFKTGVGEYGAGDRFLGIRVPVLRKLAREYRGLPLADVRELLRSAWHEERLLALFILVDQYVRADARQREQIYRVYMSSTSRINNWDLVDSSAEHIVGAHVRDGDRSRLRTLATSELLWERRIAIMATFCYIKRGEFHTTLSVARVLLDDPHDLIHKAVGWMLREVGKRDRAVEEAFLRRYGRRMPRTMLRYAVERFPSKLRRSYLSA
jgi:3-methyladenine DNA glycosylase AlkD